MSKKVLLTGVTGFVGHHVYEHVMKNTDWDVVGLHRGSIAGNMERLEDVVRGNDDWAARLRLVHHDIGDTLPKHVADRIGEVDYVVHMAANSHVDRSITEPLRFLKDNTVGTVNMLEWLRTQKNKPFFLYFSTDEVYGPAPEGTVFKETDAHRPNNPYAAAKAAAEDFCDAYRNTYQLPIMISNSMNIIGERQDPEKYLPLVIGKILKGEKLLVHSDSRKKNPGKRHYLHARNIADAVVFMLDHGVTGDRYNVVGDVELDNLQMAQKINGYVNEWLELKDQPHKTLEYELVDFHSSRPGHDLRYCIDGTRLKEAGFNYPITFDDSMRKTVFWTLDNKERWLNL